MATIIVPAPGTLGISVGKQFEPIPERDDDGFHPVIWFPYEARAEAEQMVADGEGRYILREDVAL